MSLTQPGDVTSAGELHAEEKGEGGVESLKVAGSDNIHLTETGLSTRAKTS